MVRIGFTKQPDNPKKNPYYEVHIFLNPFTDIYKLESCAFWTKVKKVKKNIESDSDKKQVEFIYFLKGEKNYEKFMSRINKIIEFQNFR